MRTWRFAGPANGTCSSRQSGSRKGSRGQQGTHRGGEHDTTRRGEEDAADAGRSPAECAADRALLRFSARILEVIDVDDDFQFLLFGHGLLTPDDTDGVPVDAQRDQLVDGALGLLSIWKDPYDCRHTFCSRHKSTRRRLEQTAKTSQPLSDCGAPRRQR